MSADADAQQAAMLTLTQADKFNTVRYQGGYPGDLAFGHGLLPAGRKGESAERPWQAWPGHEGTPLVEGR